MARQAGTDPTILAQLVQDAMCGVVLRPGREVILTGRASSAARQEVAAAIAEVNLDQALANAMRGGMAAVLQLFGDLRSGRLRLHELLSDIDGGLPGGILDAYASLPCRALLSHDECVFIDYRHEQQRWVMLPWMQAKDHEDQALKAQEPNWTAPLARMLTPVLSRANEKRDAAQADLDLCRIVLALQDYRASHGQYPAALPPASPALHLTDPFSGKPYVYVREGKGFLVYSIGKDMVDDGGTSNYDAQGTYRENGDIVWRCDR